MLGRVLKTPQQIFFLQKISEKESKVESFQKLNSIIEALARCAQQLERLHTYATGL